MSINLEVPLEMIDAGISSLSTGVNLLASSYLFLDSDDYDGATYTFEIVASNSHATIDYTVDLYDVTGSAIKATITVPANTTNPTRFRSGSWTPTDATNRTYGVQLAQTTSNNQLKVYVARIIVTQVNATKTRIQIPLINHSIISTANSIRVIDTTASTAYIQGTAGRYSYYKKDTSVFSSISGWSLEAVLWNEYSERTAYLGLFNATDGTPVTGAEISNLGATPTLKSVELANNAVNFDEGDIFEARIKNDVLGTFKKADVSRAALYCRLTSLVKAEIFWRIGREVLGVPSATWPEGRVLLNTSILTNPTVYLEASAICADNAEIVFLRDHLTNDSGTDGSAVSGSGLNFNSATTKVRIRSGVLTITDDDRFYAYKVASTGSLTLSNAWVIVDVTGTAKFRFDFLPDVGDPVYWWEEESPTTNLPIDVNSVGFSYGIPITEYQLALTYLASHIALYFGTENPLPLIEEYFGASDLLPVMNFDPGTLEYGTTYYIKCIVDGFESTGSFATYGYVVNPYPSDDESLLYGDWTEYEEGYRVLRWEESGIGDPPSGYWIYFKKEGGAYGEGIFLAGQTWDYLKEYTTEPLEVGKYYWRVDSDYLEEGAENAVPGTEWSFTIAGVAPTIDSQSGNTTVNEGEVVNLSVTATGTPVPSYKWYFDDVEIPGETNPTLSFTADRTDAGTYKCYVYNAVGFIWSDPIELTVQYPVEIIVQPVNLVVPEGLLATFSVTAVGVPDPQYQWYKDDVELPGENNSTLSFYTTFASEGVYRCKVSN